MGERTSYEPGTFSWTDLGTTDADGAKAFYLPLFGWEAEDMPAGDGMTYTMLALGGKNVAALYQSDDVPHPAWLSYVTVEDADATAARAKELGANVFQEPIDVLTAGRMAVLQDPTGAAFGIWQARDSIGAQLVNDPGAMSLNVLSTTDADAARSFYADLFGWRLEKNPNVDQDFWGIYLGETLNGGVMPLPEQQAGAGVPSHWLVYFTTLDIDGSVAQIQELGGQIMLEPMTIESGRIAAASDPQGAAFALFEGEVDP